jgi:hypothetical protein
MQHNERKASPPVPPPPWPSLAPLKQRKSREVQKRSYQAPYKPRCIAQYISVTQESDSILDTVFHSPPLASRSIPTLAPPMPTQQDNDLLLTPPSMPFIHCHRGPRRKPSTKPTSKVKNFFASQLNLTLTKHDKIW